MSDLAKKALIRTLGFSAFVGVLIVVTGGPTYWQGWLYWIVVSLCCLVMALYFLQHDPALVERRLSATAEKEETQQLIRTVLSAVLILLLVLPGIDHRLGWSHVPDFVVAAADVVVVLGFAIIFMTFKANSHASAIIVVAPSAARTGHRGCRRFAAVAPARQQRCQLALAAAGAATAGRLRDHRSRREGSVATHDRNRAHVACAQGRDGLPQAQCCGDRQCGAAASYSHCRPRAPRSALAEAGVGDGAGAGLRSRRTRALHRGVAPHGWVFMSDGTPRFSR